MSGWATEKEKSEYVRSVRARDGSLTCHWCGASPRRSIDHIVSRSNGGTDHLWNLVVSCTDCNAGRGNIDDPHHCQFCARAHELSRRVASP